MSESNTNRTINAIVRGVFIGGSLGAIASWVTDYPIQRAVGMGMLCGVFATLTMKDRLESRPKKKQSEQEKGDE